MSNPSADYRLHCFAQSGNAYKAALMLNLCGVSWEPVFVDFFNGGVRTPDYLELNPMGEVPVLEHGSERLSQSGVILNYLVDQTGKFGPNSPEEKRDILRWILWDNHKLTGYTSTLRFLRNFAKSGETPVTEFLEGRAVNAYKVLNKHLEGRDWIAADRPTIADISVCGYLFWPDEIGVDFDQFGHIQAWAKRIEALPGWVHPYELMPGHPLEAAS
ncbi:MAG: glutathione S-transferase [Pseudomonadota bacterium]